jgi:DNA-binding response OmpR family regulator
MNIQPLSGFQNRKPQIAIIEDEPLIAGMLEQLVYDFGYECVGTALTLETGLALIRKTKVKIDAVIVDIKLRHDLAYELCHALSDRGIPFVFASALRPEEIEAPWRKCHNIGKPFSEKSVERALKRLLTNRPVVTKPYLAPMTSALL